MATPIIRTDLISVLEGKLISRTTYDISQKSIEPKGSRKNLVEMNKTKAVIILRRLFKPKFDFEMGESSSTTRKLWTESIQKYTFLKEAETGGQTDFDIGWIRRGVAS
jgi:hypothetical protein